MLAMLARCALVACCVNLSRRSNPTAKRRAIRSSQWTLRIQSACFLADCRFCRKSSEIQSARELKVRCEDRKSVVSGKSVAVRGDVGGRRILKKKKDDKSERIINRERRETLK